MRAYLIRRSLIGILTVLGVASATFLLLRIMPGDPAVAALGDPGKSGASMEQVEALREQWGAEPAAARAVLQLAVGSGPLGLRRVAAQQEAGAGGVYAQASCNGEHRDPGRRPDAGGRGASRNPIGVEAGHADRLRREGNQPRWALVPVVLGCRTHNRGAGPLLPMAAANRFRADMGGPDTVVQAVHFAGVRPWRSRQSGWWRG